MDSNIYIALGSNLGNRIDNLNRAYALIEERVGRILIKSKPYSSKAVGFESDEDFVNSVIEIESEMDAVTILSNLHLIEKELGRTPKLTEGYEDRIIDLDLLDFKGEQQNMEEIIIPHPRMHERLFVLEPLSEIAPNWVHPALKMRVSEILQKISAEGVKEI